MPPDQPNIDAGATPATDAAAWEWHDQTNVLLRAAIESANDAIVITEATLDPPGPRIEYVNPAFVAMTGYTRDEVLGQTPRILQGPRTDRNLLRRLREDLQNGRFFHGETINYRKDGSAYFVEWRISPLRDGAGRPLKWVAVQRDVTERRLAEERRDALLQAERAARAEAERVGRMKDEFLATLSHELRTPLNAILGWGQLLAGGRLGEAESRRALETIVRNARNQSQLIDDLLDMSRIMNGTIRLEMSALQMAGVIEAAVQSLRPTADAKGVRLELLPSTSSGLVLGDAARLQQVLWNLLSNAIKFTPSGGAVRVRSDVVGSHLQVSVSDDGIGIDNAFLPHVFERFRQADASTTRRHGGLGLGLAIVKQLVELHGGTVTATSEGLGRGTAISIRLPLAATQPANEAPGGTPLAITDAQREDEELLAGIDLTGVSVLLVDDEADARSYVRHAIETAGGTVVEAASATQMLAALAAGLPDVLVSDIGMAGMDGYELIRQLRHRPNDRERNIPAIALTAFARSEDRRRALLAGYQSHLAKPVDTVDLIIEIASLCGRARVGD